MGHGALARMHDMITKKIQITGLIASARRYNRLQFEIVEDSGDTTAVVYPRSRNGDEDDSLAVEDGIFSLATSIFYSTTTATDRVAMAKLYTNPQCCCCTKVHVEGILSLTPVEPEPATEPEPAPAPAPEPEPAPAPAPG